MTYDKKTLIYLTRQLAVKMGDFTLASGQKSNYYIDLSKVTSTSSGLMQACLGLNELIDPFDSFGGPVLGAVPLISGVSLLRALRFNIESRTFMVRQKPKEHGNDDLIEGQLAPNDTVVLIEDVITTGKSVYEAIKAVESHNAIVVKVVAVLDREAGAKKFLADKGYSLISLLSVSDIFEDVNAVSFVP